jgi:hypothetical protein
VDTEKLLGHVLPLGVFGVSAGQEEMTRLRDELRSRANVIPRQKRAPIAHYLRGGTVIFAIMEYTRDVIAGAFGASGGSAILTDGSYYWRLDAADYVEHYGIGLPEEFVAHGQNAGWRIPSLARDEALAIDRFLLSHIRKLPKQK